jgi:glycine/D-amino acid oxidase-like deaminating enzyme
MKRREFLQSTGALGIAAAVAPFGQSYAADDDAPDIAVNRVVVIGAGIVGSSIAYNLSKRGCEVTVLDKQGPAAQASGNSFAWINASYFDTPDSYFLLRTHSLNEYHRLAAEVDFPVRWGGSLEWYHSDEAEKEVIDGVRRIQQQGAPTWMIDDDRVAELEPKLDMRGDRQAVWCSRDGAVDPAKVTRALIDGLARNGGQLVAPAEVQGIEDTADGVVVRTDAGDFAADLVVVAAGASANDIGRMINLGSDLVVPATPGVIVTTRPMDPVLNTICYTTDSHFHQLADGRVVIGEKAGPPQTEQHGALLTGRPNAYPNAELATQHADRVIATASRYVTELADAEVERVGVGWRPLPLDGLPTVGHVPASPRVYLASMHSGVTLAPIVGHLAAMEILDRVRIDLLGDFRVERFL